MKQILGMAPIAVRYAKVAINRGIEVDLKTGLELEKDVCAITFGSEDKQEGMDAFLEKRSPVFKNK
ncbi:putative enoyl-CoA hydratase echA8 [bioreactor metagenome]|uniref:Putative enoyl-CoA hydratase echA8 n=1 Tax=bioreactor metagenome TaxID=1076179 RepID=A0A645ACV8_9ZZZZ